MQTFSLVIQLRIRGETGLAVSIHNQPKWLLYPQKDSNFSVEIPLEEEEYIVGRGDECNIVFQKISRLISRKHFRLSLFSNENKFTYKLLDCSINGTLINGSHNNHYATLKNGDIITFGGCGEYPRIEFKEQGEESGEYNQTLGQV